MGTTFSSFANQFQAVSQQLVDAIDSHTPFAKGIYVGENAAMFKALHEWSNELKKGLRGRDLIFEHGPQKVPEGHVHDGYYYFALLPKSIPVLSHGHKFEPHTYEVDIDGPGLKI